MELWEKIKSNEIVTKVVDFVCKYTNIKPIMEVLQSGKTIQSAISIVLRIFAVLFGVGLLIFWIMGWRFINQFRFFGGLGYLVWQLAFFYVGILITKIFYKRAAEVKDQPESEYIITPVIALLMVTFGEIIFIFLGLMSVPAMLAVWMGGRELFHSGSVIGFLLSSMSVVGGNNVFLAGIVVFVTSWVVGFMTLVLFRLITETTLAVVSIAKDASLMRQQITEK